MDIDFRTARPADIERLLPLVRAFRASEGLPWDELAVRAALVGLMVRPGAGAAWLIEDSGGAIGYLAVTLGYSLEYGGRDGFVDELYVAPPARGRGLARRALEVAERYCRRHEVHTLHLVVRRENHPARRLYSTYGFAARDRLVLSRPVLPADARADRDASPGSGVQ